jgi:hypothetical protein
MAAVAATPSGRAVQDRNTAASHAATRDGDAGQSSQSWLRRGFLDAF